MEQTHADSTSWRAAKQSLPPAWVDKMEQVEEDVSKIQLKSKQYKILVRYYYFRYGNIFEFFTKSAN